MTHSSLKRLLAPRSVAVVGASESLPMAVNIVPALLSAGRDVFLVNPRRAAVFGQVAHADLAAIGRPVDAVVSLVNAELTVGVVEQAAALGCGGVVAVAGGFAEAGRAGLVLQARLLQAARQSGMAVVGPNCAGFMNVAHDTWLFTGARLPVARGTIAVISQSGFFVRGAFAAGLERGLGFSYGVSSGNEAVCEVADYLDYLIADAHTRVVCLVLEKLRDAPRFFRAVAEARVRGKPVIALKLGRSEKGRAISQSHTGAIADDAWVYDVALRHHGVLLARDVDDLLDQAQLFCQIEPQRWSALPRAAVITTSGGVAAHAADVFGEEGVALPIPDNVAQWVKAHVPEAGLANPIDMTGFVVGKAETTSAMFDTYAKAFDAVALAWWSGPHDEAWATRLTEPFAAAAQRNPATAMVLSAAHGGALGDWAVGLRERGVAVTHGLRSLARAIRAMQLYMGYAAGPAPEATQALARPAVTMINTPEGSLLPFGPTMQLLQQFGVPVAPYVLIDALSAVPTLPTLLGPALVVKLANVPHRTEHGAVEVGVAVGDLPGVVVKMRDIARRDALDAQVVVQSMVRGSGELFVGIQASSDLGPVLVCGLGGIFVELLKKVSGAKLPLDAARAAAMLDEVAGDSFLAGFRGQPPWDRAALQALLQAVGLLGAGTEGWLLSLDLNPVICSDRGCAVVDAVCLVRA